MSDSRDIFAGRQVTWLEDATDEDYGPDQVVMRTVRVHFADGGTAVIVAGDYDGPYLVVEDSVAPATERTRPS